MPRPLFIRGYEAGYLFVQLRIAAPERIIIAHPFNPPHLVPLVELYGPDTELVQRLVDFYRSIGKQPVMLRKEMIGHIANRLSLRHCGGKRFIYYRKAWPAWKTSTWL